MLNENAKKWVAALRSGKYKQGRYRLTTIENDEQFDCCLGVACKVAIENGVKLNLKSYKVSGNDGIEYGDERAFLPSIVMEWLNIRSRSGVYDDLPLSISLTNHNDMGKTFEAIADIIESEPKGLFNE